MNLFQPKNRMFYRLFHQGAKAVGLDSAGRVLVPVTHMERVGLKKEVMLIAYNDRVEIWDRNSYFEMIDENMTDFADLAQDVMGEFDKDPRGDIITEKDSQGNLVDKKGRRV